MGLVHGDDPERCCGEGGGRGVHIWEHMYTRGGFMSMYGKTKALTRWTFAGKVMSLLFNMLSRLVITFFQDTSQVLAMSRHIVRAQVNTATLVLTDELTVPLPAQVLEPLPAQVPHLDSPPLPTSLLLSDSYCFLLSETRLELMSWEKPSLVPPT